MNTERFASRKFLLVLLALAIGVGLRMNNMLDAQIVDLMKWALGLYFGFNVGQKALVKEPS